jgi:xanthine/CO dehydrogenase XdhC/CoxF family maturation factor
LIVFKKFYDHFFNNIFVRLKTSVHCEKNAHASTDHRLRDFNLLLGRANLSRLGRRSGRNMGVQIRVCQVHNSPRIDDPALGAGLRAKCFYIGALGSKITHARRLERMRAAGFSEAELAQIHSPIGLAIGAANPAEIGIAIVAEIIAALRKRSGAVEKVA